jgi:hypothetical protein
MALRSTLGGEGENRTAAQKRSQCRPPIAFSFKILRTKHTSGEVCAFQSIASCLICHFAAILFGIFAISVVVFVVSRVVLVAHEPFPYRNTVKF